MMTQDKSEKQMLQHVPLPLFSQMQEVTENLPLSLLAGMTSTGLSFSATWQQRLFSVVPHKVELQEHM